MVTKFSKNRNIVIPLAYLLKKYVLCSQNARLTTINKITFINDLESLLKIKFPLKKRW